MPAPARIAPNYLEIAASRMNEQDRKLREHVFTLVAMAGGSLSDQQVGSCKYVRPVTWKGKTFRELISTTYTAANLNFAINRNNSGGFVVGTNVQQGNAIVIEKVGLIQRDDLQLATWREIVALGSYQILMPNNASIPTIDVRPLVDIMIGMGDQIGQPAVATTATTTTIEKGVAGLGINVRNLPKLDQPIFLVNGQTAELQIQGLAGTAAGSSPTWGVVPYLVGWELVGVTS